MDREKDNLLRQMQAEGAWEQRGEKVNEVKPKQQKAGTGSGLIFMFCWVSLGRVNQE